MTYSGSWIAFPQNLWLDFIGNNLKKSRLERSISSWVIWWHDRSSQLLWLNWNLWERFWVPTVILCCHTINHFYTYCFYWQKPHFKFLIAVLFEIKDLLQVTVHKKEKEKNLDCWCFKRMISKTTLWCIPGCQIAVMRLILMRISPCWLNSEQSLWGAWASTWISADI